MLNYDKFMLGDTVWVNLTVGRHEGIVTSLNKITARSLKHGGVCTVTFSEFSGRNQDGINNHGHIGKFSRQETVMRALSREGEIGYNLASNQCIHFANEVNGLPRNSRMLGIALTAGLSLFLLYVIIKAKPNLKLPV